VAAAHAKADAAMLPAGRVSQAPDHVARRNRMESKSVHEMIGGDVVAQDSGYLKQSELYRLGLLVTLFFLVVFLIIGTPWILLVA
jgi:hypothetical protein